VGVWYNAFQNYIKESVMTRMSKQGKRRNICPKKRQFCFDEKTGSKKDNLKEGFKEKVNILDSLSKYIPKVKNHV
jgi:hypothetical protein